EPDLTAVDYQGPADRVYGVDLGYLDQAEQTFVDERGPRVVVRTSTGEDEYSCADLGQAGARAVNPAVQGQSVGAVLDAHDTAVVLRVMSPFQVGLLLFTLRAPR